MAPIAELPVVTESEQAVKDMRRGIKEAEARMGVASVAQLMREVEAAVLAEHGAQVWPTVDDLITEMSQREQRLALETRQKAIRSALELYGSLGRHDAVLALPAGSGAQDEAVTTVTENTTTSSIADDGIIDAEIVEEPKPVRKPAARKPRVRRPASGK